ncbi:MAG: hypothetical protein ACXVDE_03690 [Tumebacillaceae bacterium]
MVWIYLMKITLLLVIAGFFVTAVARLISKKRDWVEIVFYFFITVIALLVYLYNFYGF